MRLSNLVGMLALGAMLAGCITYKTVIVVDSGEDEDVPSQTGPDPETDVADPPTDTSLDTEPTHTGAPQQTDTAPHSDTADSIDTAATDTAVEP